MSAAPRTSLLAPFTVRSYRFQWPADLATSWAFEMETLILGWYVLVETRSVLLLTVFGSLQYLGTLIAPMFGVVGDRIGHRNLLCAMRALYTALGGSMAAFALTGTLTPVHVFVIAALMGCVRPSDLVMRNTLIGGNMPADLLMPAVSFNRTTSDSARVVGALAGAGLVATFGMGPTYAAIASLYGTSFLLTLRVGDARLQRQAARNALEPPARSSPWRDLRDAASYVRGQPHLIGALALAFLVNFCAYPLILGLLPYVAKEIYHTDQTGLGYLVASFASGGLLGSILISRIGERMRPARTMLLGTATWYSMLVVYAWMTSLTGGICALLLAGFAQSFCMVPMATMLLRNAEERFRGRVMGLRAMAIYGLPLGLLAAGQLVPVHGYPVMATGYCLFGIGCTVWIGYRWREYLWRLASLANGTGRRTL